MVLTLQNAIHLLLFNNNSKNNLPDSTKEESLSKIKLFNLLLGF